MHVNLDRRTLLRVGATLLSGQAVCNSARAESVELHSPDRVVPVVPPMAAPDLTLRTLAGAPASLRAYLGRPLVLNFWATWCVPCVAELPELDRLAAAGDIAVLVVSADHSGAAAVTPFLAKHPISHATVLLDPSSDAVHALQVFGFPTTIIIDAKGQVRGRLEGPATWGTASAEVHRLTS